MAQDALTLRRATTADLDVILHHRTEMFREMGFADEDSAIPASRAFFEKALAQGKYHAWFFVDSEGNVAAGGGIILLDYQPGPLQPGPVRPFVVNVWTEHAHRRQRLARRLMEAMIAWSREQGFQALNLHASEAGRALYEELGFVRTNEMRLKL